MIRTHGDGLRSDDLRSDGLVDLLRETADGLGKLIGDHVRLARLELVGDARRLAGRAAVALALLPFVVVGWGVVSLAIAMLLARWIGQPGALAIVGGVQLVGGALGIAYVVRRMRRGPTLMNQTTEEARETAMAIAASAGRDGATVLSEAHHTG